MCVSGKNSKIIKLFQEKSGIYSRGAVLKAYVFPVNCSVSVNGSQGIVPFVSTRKKKTKSWFQSPTEPQRKSCCKCNIAPTVRMQRPMHLLASHMNIYPMNCLWKEGWDATLPYHIWEYIILQSLTTM